MKPLPRVVLVASGYIICLLLAAAAVAVRLAATGDASGQAASGMYGFGDTLLFVAVFAVSALVPTGVALYFLRPNRPFWSVISASALALAATGMAAEVLFVIGRGDPKSLLGELAGYSVLRLLVSPLLALVFLVCAGFSPHRAPRISFLIAAGTEIAVGAAWFLPHLFRGP